MKASVELKSFTLGPEDTLAPEENKDNARQVPDIDQVSGADYRWALSEVGKGFIHIGSSGKQALLHASSLVTLIEHCQRLLFASSDQVVNIVNSTVLKDAPLGKWKHNKEDLTKLNIKIFQHSTEALFLLDIFRQTCKYCGLNSVDDLSTSQWKQRIEELGFLKAKHYKYITDKIAAVELSAEDRSSLTAEEQASKLKKMKAKEGAKATLKVCAEFIKQAQQSPRKAIKKIGYVNFLVMVATVNMAISMLSEKDNPLLIQSSKLLAMVTSLVLANPKSFLDAFAKHQEKLDVRDSILLGKVSLSEQANLLRESLLSEEQKEPSPLEIKEENSGYISQEKAKKYTYGQSLQNIISHGLADTMLASSLIDTIAILTKNKRLAHIKTSVGYPYANIALVSGIYNFVREIETHRAKNSNKGSWAFKNIYKLQDIFGQIIKKVGYKNAILVYAAVGAYASSKIKDNLEAIGVITNLMAALTTVSIKSPGQFASQMKNEAVNNEFDSQIAKTVFGQRAEDQAKKEVTKIINDIADNQNDIDKEALKKHADQLLQRSLSKEEIQKLEKLIPQDQIPGGISKFVQDNILSAVTGVAKSASKSGILAAFNGAGIFTFLSSLKFFGNPLEMEENDIFIASVKQFTYSFYTYLAVTLLISAVKEMSLRTAVQDNVKQNDDIEEKAPVRDNICTRLTRGVKDSLGNFAAYIAGKASSADMVIDKMVDKASESLQKMNTLDLITAASASGAFTSGIVLKVPQQLGQAFNAGTVVAATLAVGSNRLTRTIQGYHSGNLARNRENEMMHLDLV